MAYLVQLRQFEGPLDLLLYLIRKEEMDILDLNIAEITRQFLDHLKLIRELDLEGAGEFVSMAATLIHIKSRMLLPQYGDDGEVVEQDDPRRELVQKLLEYQKYQGAAQKLYDRPLLNRDVFTRGTRENLKQGDEWGEIEVEEGGLFGLIAAFRRASRKAERAIHKVRPKVQSIASRILEMRGELTRSMRDGVRIRLKELLEVAVGVKTPRVQLLVTFLSVLELGRLGFVRLFQNETYGDIYIEPRREIEGNVLERVQEFDAGDAEAVAQQMAIDSIEASDEQASQPSAAGQALLFSDDGPVFQEFHEITVEHAEDLILKSMDGGQTAPTGDVPDGPHEMATDEEIEAALLESQPKPSEKDGAEGVVEI